MTQTSEYTRQPNAWTCQSACVAQMLGLGEDEVNKVRFDLEQLGQPGDPYIMGKYLKDRVPYYNFREDASINDLTSLMRQGYKCITHGWFTPSGHVISVMGVAPDHKTLGKTFLVDDPWQEFDFPSGEYTDRTGNNVFYSSYGIYAYCVAGSSYDHARQIYKQGKLNSAEPNMWLHVIR